MVQAIAKFEESHKMKKSIHEEEHSMLETIENLVKCHEDLRNKTEVQFYKNEIEAIKKKREALAEAMKNADIVKMEEFANKIANRAAIQDDLASFYMAIHNFEEAVARFINLYPAGHRKIAANLNRLGDCYWKIGKFDDAMQCHSRSLKMWNSLCGRLADRPSHPASESTLGTDLQR